MKFALYKLMPLAVLRLLDRDLVTGSGRLARLVAGEDRSRVAESLARSTPSTRESMIVASSMIRHLRGAA